MRPQLSRLVEFLPPDRRDQSTQLQCVDYNRNEGSTYCQGVNWRPEDSNACERYSMSGYLGSRHDSIAQIATLRLCYPETTQSNHCAGVTATGPFRIELWSDLLLDRRVTIVWHG